MQQVKYYRQDHMIFGVYRGTKESYDEPRLNEDGTPAVNKDTGVPIIDAKSRYVPHEKEGQPDYDNVVFKGDSINSAKKKSRELQGATLGSGILRVLPPVVKQSPHEQGFNPNLRSIKRKPRERKHRSEYKKSKSNASAEV